jgi:hypothetical protein
MKPIVLVSLVVSLCASVQANAQTPTPAKHRICLDVAHQQKFWGDPADMDEKRVERVKYMTGEMLKTAAAVKGSLAYLKKEITPPDLKGCNLLFIHIPSAKYTPGEVGAISKYIASGGALFLAMDQDMWSTLDQTNVNDLIRPFGVQFGGESPDSQAGGHTKAGPALEDLVSRRKDGHGWHSIRLQRPLRYQSLRHIQRGGQRRKDRRHGRWHGLAVHDQLGRCERLPVPGVHAGGVSVVAEVRDVVERRAARCVRLESEREL